MEACHFRGWTNRTRRLGALVVCLTLFPLVSVRAADDPLDDYKLAVGFYNKEQWKLAADSFQTFLKNAPQHPKVENARYYLGLTLVKLDNFKQAREVLRTYVKDFPKSKDVPIAAYWIGHCSYHLDEFAAAEGELGTFIQRSPGDPLLEWAVPYLADVELRLKKPELAEKHFAQSLKDHPQGALAEDARFGLARSYELLKKPAEAIKLYQELAANRAGSRAAEAQLNLGAYYFEARDFTSAAAAYAALEKNFPQSPLVGLAQLNQGFAKYQLGDFRGAAAQFDKVTKIEKHAAEASLWKGLSLKSLAEYPQAIAVLQAAYDQFKDQPIAERLLHQWAECEVRRGEFDKAKDLYLQVVSRWPKGALADESLHAACLAAINANKLAEAETLLARFDREYPGNRLRFRQDVLKGRVLAAKNDFAGAAKQFQGVIAGSDLDSTKNQARYFLGEALQKQGQHAQVVELTAPLATAVETDKSLAEYSGVLVLRGVSLLALGKAAAVKEKPQEISGERIVHCNAAGEAARKYLAIAPNGPLAAQAWGIRIQAGALGGNKQAVEADLQSLRKSFATAPEMEQTLFELGTIAYAREDWEWAESLFNELAAKPKESRFHSRALADLGWTQQKRKKHAEAAATFARLLTDHPNDELASEAAFMRGSALQDAGKLPEAQAAFAEAFRRKEMTDHVFLAGLQSARLLARLKKLPDSDAEYDQLLKRFPKRNEADRVLDEWATAHYNAEDYAKADELFRRLTTEYPESSLADNAKLSLAESDLVAGKLDPAKAQFAALAKDAKADETVQQRAYFQLMQIAVEAKKWDELRQICAESLQKFPKGTYRWDTEFKLAEGDFQSGALKPAAERLLKLKAERENPEVKPAAWFPQVWVMLAETQFREKQHEAVAATVDEFRQWDPKSPLLYQADEVLGRSLKAQAKFPEARVAFERAIKDPNGKQTETAAKSQFHIAETYLLEKNYATAAKEYLKVDILYKFPDWQAPAVFQAATCYEALNQGKDAAKLYDDLLKNHPSSEVAPRARERLESIRKKTAG